MVTWTILGVINWCFDCKITSRYDVTPGPALAALVAEAADLKPPKRGFLTTLTAGLYTLTFSLTRKLETARFQPLEPIK